MGNKRLTSILGIALGAKHLDMCVLRRSGGNVNVAKTIRAPIILDPLVAEPELAAQEIRNILEANGIQEKRCVICLPLKSVLALHIELPKLEGADLDSFIRLQAEKALPFAPEDMAFAASVISGSIEPAQATVTAISLHHVNNLSQMCKAAGLKPQAITLSIAALAPPAGKNQMIALETEDGAMDFAVFANGGLALVRSLDAAGSGSDESYDRILEQQLRITLARLPESIRSGIQSLQVYGQPESARKLTKKLHSVLAPIGMRAEMAATDQTGRSMDAAVWSPAVCAATDIMSGNMPAINFLPPYVSPLRKIAGRISAKRALYLGGSIGATALIISLLFTFQTIRLKRLESQWAAIKPQVEQAEDLQRKVRGFRPWFDPASPSLEIMSKITGAFPVTGTVWLKSMSIKDHQQITCAAHARSSRDWLAVLDALRNTPGIADLQVTQVRGENPLQIGLSFRWEEESSHAK